jgi:hypothetical protein
MVSNIFLLLGIFLGYMIAICFYWLERDRRIRAEKSSDDWMEWCFKLLDEYRENNQSQCDKKELNNNDKR